MGILSLITSSTEATVAMVFKYLKILKLKLGYFNALYEASLSLTQIAYIFCGEISCWCTRTDILLRLLLTLNIV